MSARWKMLIASTIVSNSWTDRRTYTSWLRGKFAPIPLKVYRPGEHTTDRQETSMRNRVAFTIPALWVCALLAFLLAGCGADATMSTEEAERRLTTIMQREIAGEDPPVYVGNVGCVADGDQAWQCVAEVDAAGVDPVELSGTFRCDGRGCVWRAD